MAPGPNAPFVKDIQRGEPLTGERLNNALVDNLIRVLVGGKGIIIRRFGMKLVIESTGAGVAGGGATGTNGTWA